MNFTISHIKKSKVAHLNMHLSAIKRKEKSKFRSEKTFVGKIIFDSKKEAARYKELRFLEKKGKILYLELQVPFELNQSGSFSYKYIADFVYFDANTNEKIVEDCKGYRTAEYKRKRRLMAKVYGIKIFET